MSRKKEKYTKPLPISIYWRLLKYVKPYKWRLTLGILAGLVASGSMFGGIMVLPQLVKGVNVVSPETMEQNRRTAVKIIRKLDEVPKQNYEARENAVEAVLNEPSGRGVLEHNVDKTEKKLQKFLPASWNIHVVYDQGTVVLQMFGKNVIGIPAETRTGKMTWLLYCPSSSWNWATESSLIWAE